MFVAAGSQPDSTMVKDQRCSASNNVWVLFVLCPMDKLLGCRSVLGELLLPHHPDKFDAQALLNLKLV